MEAARHAQAEADREALVVDGFERTIPARSVDAALADFDAMLLGVANDLLRRVEPQAIERGRVGTRVGIGYDEACHQRLRHACRHAWMDIVAAGRQIAAITTRLRPSRPTSTSDCNSDASARRPRSLSATPSLCSSAESALARLSRSVDQLGRYSETTLLIASLKHKVGALSCPRPDEFD